LALSVQLFRALQLDDTNRGKRSLFVKALFDGCLGIVGNRIGSCRDVDERRQMGLCCH
jgi:hypothetical protein